MLTSSREKRGCFLTGSRTQIYLPSRFVSLDNSCVDSDLLQKKGARTSVPPGRDGDKAMAACLGSRSGRGKKLYSVQTLYKPSRELEEDRGVSLSFAFSLSPPLFVCLYPGPSLLPSPVSLLMFLTDFSRSPQAQRSRGAEDRGQEARARERGGTGGGGVRNDKPI